MAARQSTLEKEMTGVTKSSASAGVDSSKIKASGSAARTRPHLPV